MCALADGQKGFCTARVNRAGSLYTLAYANPVAVHVDPIEKKPFFHVLPGSTAFSLAVAGCNMRCLFCQNWQISQGSPDEKTMYDLPPSAVAAAAAENHCPFVVYTYTEPTIFFEYMRDCAVENRKRGLKNGMHSCGYINPAPLKELLAYMDAVNVDIKGFSEDFYRKIGAGAQLAPVLETLTSIKREGVWLELTNLLIPGYNDDPALIRKMCEWIRDNLGDEVPLHFSRFIPAFQLQNLMPTPVEKLEAACAIAREAGLKYVYIGNVPGHERENTFCPGCGRELIHRIGYEVLTNRLKNGACPDCGRKIPGIWDSR